MSQLKRNIYVGIVPQWLAEVLTQKQLDVQYAMLYENLATTISAEEVCFYHAYNLKFNNYIGNDFDDLLKIYQNPQNIAWLNAHDAELQRAISTFNHAFNMNADKLALQSSPKSIRQTNYKAMPGSDESILLVGNGPYSDFERTRFVVSCIESLELILPFPVYSQLKIFSVYTRLRR